MSHLLTIHHQVVMKASTLGWINIEKMSVLGVRGGERMVRGLKIPLAIGKKQREVNHPQ